MKIRYYLRGLGLGILVTSVFFLVGDGSDKTMSDEQIKARAKELGMIESTVLAEISTEEMYESAEDEAVMEESSIEAVAETKTAVVEETTVTVETEEESSASEAVEEVSSETEESKAEEESVEESKVENKADTAEETSKTDEISAEEPASTAANSEAVSIVVYSGEGSDDVSRRLADMGLVADAHEYDRYLMANGYDKKIRTGEHIIPAGAAWEEMAKILCNQN